MIAILALENGNIFEGVAIGAIDGNLEFTCGELVFNTAMTGYQEIISDPSYCEQVVLFTAPHIGNIGVNPSDTEHHKVWSKGVVIKSLSLVESNWRSTNSLNLYLQKNNLLGIANVDTRAITAVLRDQGAQRCCIHLVKDVAHKELIKRKALELAQAHTSLNNLDLAKLVTTQQVYEWTEATLDLNSNSNFNKPSEAITNFKPLHIVVYDFGVKQQILRLLINRNCKVTVVPAQTSMREVLALKPDGILLSNGPGDPAACTYAIEAARELIKLNMPIFGICLGFQILALALGLKTIKMKFGHHGANHPVKDLFTDRVLITSQNHGFMAEEPQGDAINQITITHRSLFDNTIQGVKHNSLPIIGFQGHPEASPGPNDIEYLFDTFIENISSHQSTVEINKKACQNAMT